MTECSRNCWIFAALMGLLVWLLALGPGGAGMFGGLFLGFVTAWLVGGLMILLFCQGRVEDAEEFLSPVQAVPPAEMRARSDKRIAIARAARPAGMSAAPQGASADPRQAVTFASSAALRRAERHEADERTALDRAQRGARTGAPPGASPDAREAATFAPSAALMAAEDRLEAAEAAIRPIETGAPHGASADPRQAVTFGTGREVTDRRAARAVVDAATRLEERVDPQAVHVMPVTAGDDLLQISGIGPVLRDRLLEGGVTSFAQISAWTDEDVAAWADRLGRNAARIGREDWIGQARRLAAGQGAGDPGAGDGGAA